MLNNGGKVRGVWFGGFLLISEWNMKVRLKQKYEKPRASEMLRNSGIADWPWAAKCNHTIARAGSLLCPSSIAQLTISK